MAMKPKVYRQANANKMPHLGIFLQQFLKTKGINNTILAKKLNRTVSTFYKFKKQSSFQTAILWEICHATEHNLFADLASQLPTHFAQNQNAQTVLINQLQEKINTLEIEKNQLERLLKR